MSESTEMYLKTIMELSTEEPAAISRVAQRLGVSTVSANEMMKRLGEQELITHTPYKGVELTDAGMRKALSVVRRHRLWETFLVDQLGVSWEEAHDPACQLEHATTDQVTEALAIFLGDPDRCPHGNPIPGVTGDMPESPATTLNEMEVGDAGSIDHIYPEETTLLTYLAERGLYPGAHIRLVDIAPYNGPITVRMDQVDVVLGRTIAAHVFIRLTGDSK